MSNERLLITVVAQEGCVIRKPEFADIKKDDNDVWVERRQISEDVTIKLEIIMTSSGNTTKFSEEYITNLLIQKVLDIIELKL